MGVSISRITFWSLLAGALALGLWLRICSLGMEGMWMDEIFSVTFANLPPLELLIAVLRFDVHPPLYYLQLAAWSLAGHGDRWLILNSVAWSIATMLGVFVGTARRFGTGAGLLALCICAVMGSEIYFAGEARMYSMLSALTVWGWILADRLHDDYRFRTGLPLLVLLVALGMSHSLSLIPVSAVLVYALPWGMQQWRRLMPTWLKLAAITLAALAPWLVLAAVKKVPHPESLSPALLQQSLAGWLLGFGNATLPGWAQPVAAAAVIILVCLAVMLRPRSTLTRIAASFIVWPLLLGAALCLLVRPIWLADRTFAFCAPFVAVVAGALLSRALATGAAVRVVGSVAAGVVLATLAWTGYAQAVTPHKMEYRDLANYLREHVTASEFVYVPELTMFWGVARYLDGPQWGNPLQVQDPLDVNRLQSWKRIYDRLGTERLNALHLVPQTRRLDGFKTPLITGWTPFAQLDATPTYWVVTSTGVDLAELNLCSPRNTESIPFGRQIDLSNYIGLMAYRVHCT